MNKIYNTIFALSTSKVNKRLINVLLFYLLTYSLAFSQNISSTGLLNVPRYQHQSQLLYNGQVLCFGGDNGEALGDIVYNTAQLYNPVSGTWSTTGAMNTPRTIFSSVVLPNGNIMAIGGIVSLDGGPNSGNNTSSCEIYDVTLGTWSYADSMNAARDEQKTILLKNGKVLLVGDIGPTTIQCELYDPTTNTWTAAQNPGFAETDGIDLVTLADGKILATINNSAKIFDPNTELWTSLASPLIGNRQYHSSILLNNGSVLLSGSINPSDQATAELYDPIAQTFTATGSMSEDRTNSPTILMDNGKVLAFGIGDLFSPSDTKLIEVYDPTAGTWSSNIYTLLGTQAYTIHKLGNGKILIVGGSASSGNGASQGCELIDQNIGTCTTPNLALSVTGNSTCIGNSSSISISNSETGVNYTAYLGNFKIGTFAGTGNNLSIPITYSSINNGNNIYTVQALKSSCPSFLLSDTADIIAGYAVAQPVINPSGPLNICNGDSIQLSAPTGYSSYLWSNNKTTQSIYIDSAKNYSVMVTNESGCISQYSTSVNLTLNPIVIPTITIAASANSIDTGTTVNFTSTPINPGTMPIYQWSVNGVNAGTNSNTFSSNVLNNNDQVTCKIISNAVCVSSLDSAMSNVITMSVFAIGLLPTITSFTPMSGTIGTSVTITGTNFNNVASNNIVYFGAVKAVVSNASSTSLIVTVPSGATNQSISVTTGTLTAYSSQLFVPTFICGGIIDTGSFASRADFTVGYGPNNIAIGDLDGDGKSELITPNEQSNSLSVLPNTSSAGNISFASRLSYAIGSITNSVSIGDLDGDGKLDLAVTVGSSICVLKNTSSIGAISFAPKQNFGSNPSPWKILIEDMDNDGKPDLVTVNNGSNTVSVLKNTTEFGIISFAPGLNYTVGNSPMNIAISDIDGDGKSDIITVNDYSNTVSVLRNLSVVGATSFAPKVDFVVGSGSFGPDGITVGDLDGNGKPDLAMVSGNSKNFSILENSSTIGMISFNPVMSFPMNDGYLGSIVMGDLDGDQKEDLVITGVNQVNAYKNTSTIGNISFVANAFVSGDYYYPGYSSIADLNGDGKPEILLSSDLYYNVLSVWKNNVGYLPTITNIDSLNVCSGNTLNVPISPGANSSIFWSANNNLNITGESTSIKTTSLLNDTLFNNTGLSQVVMYTITATNGVNDCSVNKELKVTISPFTAPHVSGGKDISVCYNSVITLHGSGAKTYTWNNYITNGVAFVTDQTTTYTVTGVDSNNCSSTAQVIVTVNPLPYSNSTIRDTAICAGSSITLSGFGANNCTYSWDKGVINGVAFIPTTSNYYTVTATDSNDCSWVAAPAYVGVNSLPDITISGPTQPVCIGANAVLSTSAYDTINNVSVGILSSVWNNGVVDGMSFYPTVTKTYTVSVTDSYNCTHIDSTIVAVSNFSVPTINAGNDTTVCSGTSVTLNATGASTIEWETNGVSNGVPFIPTATTTYYVYGIDLHNCGNASQVTITVDTTCFATAIVNPTNEELNISVYPNPANNILYVDMAEIPNTLLLYNAQGKIVQRDDHTNSINVTLLANGLYTLQIILDKVTFVEKVQIDK